MDKDRIKDKMEDIGGRIERQAGEWTADKEAQAEGMKHQVKGKMRNAAGKVKDAGREAMEDVRHEEHNDGELDREKGAA